MHRAFSIFRLVAWISASNVEVAKKKKKCNTCGVNGCHGKKCYISPNTFLFVIIPEMFWRNFIKIRHIYIPYKFAQRGSIPSKIKCKILARKGLQTIRTMPGDYLAL